MFKNTSPEVTKFSLPSNAFYGNGSVTPTNSASFNLFEMPASATSKWKTSRTTFTQSTSRTLVKEAFLKEFGAVTREKRNSTDLKRSLRSLPVNRKNMVVRNRSNRSTSPDWATCRFSLPMDKKKDHQTKDLQNKNHQKQDHQKKDLQKKDNQKQDHQKKDYQKKDHQKEDHQKEDHQKGDHQKKDHQKVDHQKEKENQNKQRKRRSISKQVEDEESKKENRQRSVSPDWDTSRFSLAPVTLKSTPSSPKSSPKMKKITPLVNLAPRNIRSRSASPDWNTSRFSLPKTSVESLKSIHKKVSSVSPRISAPLAHRFKTKINQNTMYTISQNTLDKLLPKPEIYLFDVVKYGPHQHKDDFLFGLNLMRSEVLSKIDLLHYKKKLRNTGTNFIRTFQQSKKRRPPQKKSDDSNDSKKVVEQEELLVPIEVPDEPDEIVIDDVETVNGDTTVIATDEIDKPEEVIQIEDDDHDEDKEVDRESEKLLEEAIQDFADKFGGEIVDETTETSNVIDSNIDNFMLSGINGNKNTTETVKISKTNTFYHSVTKKRNKNSLDSNNKLFSKTSNHNDKRNSLPYIKNIKKNGVPKKKVTPNKKKNIIKVKWPIARKSLLDLRNKS